MQKNLINRTQKRKVKVQIYWILKWTDKNNKKLRNEQKRTGPHLLTGNEDTKTFKPEKKRMNLLN